MATTFSPKRLLVSGAVGLVALAVCLAGQGRQALPEANAQDKGAEADKKKADDKKPGVKKKADDEKPDAKKADEPKEDLKPKYIGASTCAACHSHPIKAGFKDDYVLLNEYDTWSKKDKHSQAYKVLEGDRSKHIGLLLGIADVTKDNRCLNCHSANVPKEEREEAEKERLFQLSDGVSCDACHGPSSVWLGQHILPGWRTKPMSKKQELGFRDVRNPIPRSNLCLSCHVGDETQGKVVTHDIYAAGHPPLPGIEIATFSDEMPRHWRYIKEKKPEIQSGVYQKTLGIDPQELEKTKLAVVGNVVALQAQMKALDREAKKGTEGPDAGKNWPDFAQFDCYACHHDLKTDSWRQKRGYVGKPGRPQVRPWPLALVELGSRQANPGGAGKPSKDMQEHLAKLYAVFDSRPFGDPNKVVTEATSMEKWAGELIKDLNGQKYDQAAARRLLHELCVIPKDMAPDYDSARQISWAARIIYSDVEPKPANDKEIQAVLDALKKELKLDLPSGTGRNILEEMDDSLKRVSDYEPDKFRARMQELSKLFSKE